MAKTKSEKEDSFARLKKEISYYKEEGDYTKAFYLAFPRWRSQSTQENIEQRNYLTLEIADCLRELGRYEGAVKILKQMRNLAKRENRELQNGTQELQNKMQELQRKMQYRNGLAKNYRKLEQKIISEKRAEEIEKAKIEGNLEELEELLNSK